MKEIEIKLSYKDKNKVISKLKEIGAKKRDTVVIEDTYYSLDSTEMSNVNNLLRIREKTGKKPELTFKGNCIEDNGIWERTEINVDLSSAENMKKIIESLKFNFIKCNKTVREYWDYKNVELVFMDFVKPKKLELIEIESEDKSAIEDLTNQLGDEVKIVGEEIFKIFD